MRSLWALQSISAAAMCTPPKSRFGIEQSFVESLDGRRAEGSAPRVLHIDLGGIGNIGAVAKGGLSRLLCYWERKTLDELVVSQTPLRIKRVATTKSRETLSPSQSRPPAAVTIGTSSCAAPAVATFTRGTTAYHAT